MGLSTLIPAPGHNQLKEYIGKGFLEKIMMRCCLFNGSRGSKIMDRFIVRLILLCFNLPCLVSAQDSLRSVEILSLQNAWSMAFEHNPDYQNYKLNQEKAGINHKASKSYRFPTISASINAQRNLDLATTPLPGEIFGLPEGTTIDAQFGQVYAYNAGIALSKSIFDRQAIVQSKLSKLDVQMTGVQREAYGQLLKQQVSLHYYAALIARRSIALNQRDLAVADSIVFLSNQKFDEGVIDVIALNQAKINLNTVKQSQVNHQLLYDQSVSELKKLLGMRHTDTLRLPSKLEYKLPKYYYADELLVDPGITLALVNEQQADLQVSLQASFFLPKLTANSYYGRQQFRDDFGVSFSDNAWTNFSYLSLDLSIPIFTGFANKNHYKASKVSQQVAKNELENARLTASIDDQQLINEYNYSLENAQVALETFELFQENSQLSYQKFTGGLISLDRYLGVFEDYLEAESAFLNALSGTYSYYSQIISRTE